MAEKWKGVKTTKGVPTGDGRTDPTKVEFFWPYPDGTVMTDEAVAGLVGQDVPLVLDGEHSTPAKILSSVNLPSEGGCLVELSVDKTVVNPLKPKVSDGH